MKMEVVHGLATIVARVYDDSITALMNVEFTGDLIHHDEGAPHHIGVGDIEQSWEVCARNQQGVHGRLRIEIMERDELFILVDRFHRNRSISDLAENALFT